nr:MAG TPA: hypothetical protein [Caudoviricetes sp.]DAM40423.1 MAG TPA: hypothetical protein [Caudoviricetes sp.]
MTRPTLSPSAPPPAPRWPRPSTRRPHGRRRRIFCPPSSTASAGCAGRRRRTGPRTVIGQPRWQLPPPPAKKSGRSTPACPRTNWPSIWPCRASNCKPSRTRPIHSPPNRRRFLVIKAENG